jgi:multidrug efflux pump
MERLQAKIVDAIKQDPDVSGAVSVIGASSINSTPNAGHLAITLKSRDERSAFVSEVVDRLKRAVAGIAGMVVYFQPVQDIQISTRTSRAVPVHAARHRFPEGGRLVGDAR